MLIITIFFKTHMKISNHSILALRRKENQNMSFIISKNAMQYLNMMEFFIYSSDTAKLIIYTEPIIFSNISDYREIHVFSAPMKNSLKMSYIFFYLACFLLVYL